MRCAKPSKRKSNVSADLGAWTADAGEETCEFLKIRGETQIIVNLASEELRKNSLAHYKRLWALEQLEICVRTYRPALRQQRP